MKKSDVNGENALELYTFLKSQATTINYLSFDEIYILFSEQYHASK